MSDVMDILLEDQRQIEQRKAAPPPVQLTRADRIIAEGDARRLSYRRINPGADTAMTFSAQIGYLHAQIRKLDAETEALNAVRDSALDYVTVDSIDFTCQLTVGYAYQPETPGEDGCFEDLEVQEVWVNGVDVAHVLTQIATESIAFVVLAKVHLLLAKGREQDEPQ